MLEEQLEATHTALAAKADPIFQTATKIREKQLASHAKVGTIASDFNRLCEFMSATASLLSGLQSNPQGLKDLEDAIQNTPNA